MFEADMIREFAIFAVILATLSVIWSICDRIVRSHNECDGTHDVHYERC
jgi:hypothetical protein